MCTRLQGYNLIGIMDMRGDGSCDWSVGIEGYRLFRKEGREDKEGVLPSMSMIRWSTRSSTWGWMRSKLRAYESGLNGGEGQGVIIVGIF